MKIVYDKIMRSNDSVDIIFSNEYSIRACRLFVKWLKSHDDLGPGYVTKSSVSRFADNLKEGITDSKGNTIKYSRVSFYGTVIKSLLEGGFLQKNLAVWSHSRKETLFVYAPIIFKIPLEPPTNGFYRLSYYICKKWNKNFV